MAMKRGRNGEGEEMKYRKPVVTPVANINQGAIERRKPAGTLGPDIMEKLGKQLRGYYDGLIEPIPERFKNILRQLDKPGGKGSSE
jgi:hypothetical protein